MFPAGLSWHARPDHGADRVTNEARSPAGTAEPRRSWVETNPRLAPFLEWQSTSIQDEIGPVSTAPWPAVDGCLIVLFTARSGSTFLTRELEAAFDVGKVSESLNPRKVAKRPPQKKIVKVKGAWFGAKTGIPGVVSGELCGFFDAYLARTVFIRLLRRDIVAQAVSTAKALQTRAWHSNNAPVRQPEYDADLIAKSVLKIDRAVAQLRRYAALSGRPSRPLIYEDFAGGDIAAAIGAAEALGVPRRIAAGGMAPRPVERAGDAVNDAWIARFLEGVDPSLRDRIDAYTAAIDAERRAPG